jgi:hypothetical protein
MTASHFESLESRRLMSVGLETELLVNGRAEATQGAPSGWKGSGSFSVVTYGSAGFPGLNSPGPSDRGLSFFAGGPADQPGAQAVAYQDFNVSALAHDIDAERIRAEAHASLGGFGMENDTMDLRLVFGDGVSILDAYTLPGPTAERRGGITGLRASAINSPLPRGTRFVRLELIATKRFGRYIDGYADNVSLKLLSSAGTKHGFVAGRVVDDVDAYGKDDVPAALPGVTVFVDGNGNAKLDAGEPRATSDAGGRYTISGVLPGTAVVRQVVPRGFRAVDAVARKVQVRGGLTTVAQDFTNTQSFVIAGNVFADANGNGRRDKNERGLAGARVYLDRNGNGRLDLLEAVAVTDKNGNFSFIERAGRHTVRLEDSTRQTSPARRRGFTVNLPPGGKSFGNVFATRPIGGRAV